MNTKTDKLAGERTQTSTPNGYDPRWVAAINCVLSDRENGAEPIIDITEAIWDEHIGPMIDAIEDGIMP